MELFKEKTHFDFIGGRWYAFAFSGALLAVSLGLIATKGLNYAIDFTGGNVVRLTFAQPQDIATLRTALEKAGYPEAVPQQFLGSNSFQVRIKSDDKEDAKAVDTFLEKLKAADAAREFRVESQEFVGPTVGRHLFKQALFAAVFSLLGIVVYVAFRFSNPVWGIGGVAALAHDVIITVGLMSLLGLEFDLTLVAALLTLAGYSINDTIVVFDRIRERMAIHRKEALDVQINTSINETLSRTVITSLTVFITVMILFVIGGKVIHDFALSMAFGVLIGTYSSIAVATPVVFEWENRRRPVTNEPAAEPAQQFRGKGGKRRRG